MKNLIFRSLLITTLLAGFSASAVAQNSSVPTPSHGGAVNQFADEEVAHVRLLLSGYHGLPDREALAASPNAFAIVSALSHSDNVLVRDRALEALGRFWPSGDVFLAYANVVADETTPDGMRHRIMLVAAEVFGDRAVPMIRPYLSVDDVQLRLTAVEALGRIRTDQVVAILEAHADSETNALVLERIARASRVLR